MIKKNQLDYEINLIKLVILLFQNKWKIISPIVILVFSVFVYQMTLTKNFIATTKIKTVTSVLEHNYKFFNKEFNSLFSTKNLKIFDVVPSAVDPLSKEVNSLYFHISKQLLLEDYIEALSEKKLFEEAMIKFEFLDASQYSDEQAYIEAIKRLASSVSIIIKKNKNSEILFANIQFTYHDVEKWKNVLTYVDKLANKFVKKELENKYKLLLSFLKRNREYELENLSLEINNITNDYERVTYNRIAYLKEQSEIARGLGIEKNTVEVQTFGNTNTLFSNIKLDAPFYLRGFLAIDKEIALIESRTDKGAFNPKLFNLEQKKRMVEQDKTLERATSLYLSSPLVNNLFYAASTKATATKFYYNNNRNKLLLAAIVIGLIIGLSYVFISEEIQIQKTSRKKN